MLFAFMAYPCRIANYLSTGRPPVSSALQWASPFSAKTPRALLSGQRFAGRREPRIPATEFSHLKQEAESVLRVVSEMHLRITDWKKAQGVWDDKTVKATLREEYDQERYPWMKYFGLCLSKLRPKANWKGTQLSLADPASWSAVDLARLIMKERIYHELGVQYPANEIRKHMKYERGPR